MLKIDLNIINKTDYPIPAKTKFKAAILEVLKDKKVSADISIGIDIVSKAEIQKLNKKFRKIDAPTDVLSFPIYEVAPKNAKQIMLLGDIVICPDCLPAGEAGAQDDILFLIQHATKHLLGYHHA